MPIEDNTPDFNIATINTTPFSNYGWSMNLIQFASVYDYDYDEYLLKSTWKTKNKAGWIKII